MPQLDKYFKLRIDSDLKRRVMAVAAYRRRKASNVVIGWLVQFADEGELEVRQKKGDAAWCRLLLAASSKRKKHIQGELKQIETRHLKGRI